MAKSDCGLPARSGATKQLISNEEKDFRWNYMLGNIKISDKDFNKKIAEIRKRTGKPKG